MLFGNLLEEFSGLRAQQGLPCFVFGLIMQSGGPNETASRVWIVPLNVCLSGLFEEQKRGTEDGTRQKHRWTLLILNQVKATEGTWSQMNLQHAPCEPARSLSSSATKNEHKQTTSSTMALETQSKMFASHKPPWHAMQSCHDSKQQNDPEHG